MTDNEDREFWAILWRESLRAMTLGWDLAIPIFAGVLLGQLLDRWLGTGHIFTLGLLVLGVVVAYFNLGRVIRRLAAHDRRRKLRKENEEEEEDAS
ncbi:MAG: AtpZ/AtpI family protein [Anaerolineales bacterium]|nr:AtpZ/AtpI family protein [Anaerolineales bacterium]